MLCPKFYLLSFFFCCGVGLPSKVNMKKYGLLGYNPANMKWKWPMVLFPFEKYFGIDLFCFVMDMEFIASFQVSRRKRFCFSALEESLRNWHSYLFALIRYDPLSITNHSPSSWVRNTRDTGILTSTIETNMNRLGLS